MNNRVISHKLYSYTFSFVVIGSDVLDITNTNPLER